MEDETPVEPEIINVAQKTFSPSVLLNLSPEDILQRRLNLMAIRQYYEYYATPNANGIVRLPGLTTFIPNLDVLETLTLEESRSYLNQVRMIVANRNHLGSILGVARVGTTLLESIDSLQLNSPLSLTEVLFNDPDITDAIVEMNIEKQIFGWISPERRLMLQIASKIVEVRNYNVNEAFIQNELSRFVEESVSVNESLINKYKDL